MEATKRERRSKEETSPDSLALPPEIIREILIRLPAKSIGRFRCVSKLFFSLSSDLGFAKSHLDLTIHLKLLVSSRNLCSLDLDSIFEGSRDLVGVENPSGFDEMINNHWRDHLNSVGPAVDEDDRSMMRIMKSKTYQRTWVKIIGSSKGLVCISPWKGAVFLYNPTTGEFKRLLNEKFTDEQFETLEFGFGFEDHTDDYKVVKLVANKYNRRVLNAAVYSLKADSWRRICDLNYELGGGFTSGVNVNGTVHWLLLTDHKQRVILAFDLKTEEFREMPLPAEAESYPHMGNTFAVRNLSGRLSVNNNCYEMHDDMWVMNEYGVASSWSRIQISLLYKSIKHICSTKNSEEVLMDVVGDIVLYNFETNESRNLVIRGVGHCFEADTYVESLISPN